MQAYATNGSVRDIMVLNNSGLTVSTIANDKGIGPYNMPQQFNNMGFINNNDSIYTRRPAFDYLVQVNNLMGNYVFSDSVNSIPKVFHYTKNGSNDIYAIWSPTQNGTMGNYNLTVPTNANLRVWQPRTGNDTMSLQNIKISGTTYSVAYSETPIFVEIVGSGPIIQQSRRNIEDVKFSLIATPNPSQSNFILNISIRDTREKAMLLIYNNSGILIEKREIMSNQKIQLGESYISGSYYAMLVQGSETRIVKMIKL
jgi:hypothetical protein